MAERRDFDFLVLGSGLAGLFYALRVAEHGRVAIVTKRAAADSATAWAQGGIAAVLAEDDSFAGHSEDTLVAGAGLCHADVVQAVVERAPRVIESLVRLGVRFDAAEPGGADGGGFALGREGGHRKRRILHHRDATGREIERALLERARAHANIAFFERHLGVDLITARRSGVSGADRCLGAYVLDADTQLVHRFLAPITLLATGGAGKVYLYTSNPDVASGDGIAMAYRAGATVANLEFMQFHPTCLFHPQAKSFLITEAVRGEGGILKTAAGDAFMGRHHAMADLAPRDVVARAIDSELKRSGNECVFLDITHRDAGFVRERFPNIHARCLEYGIDITRQPIPVVPATHYTCGGVRTDLTGETDVPNLFAAGEVACTGLHGANRLASNSLLEGLVYGARAGEAASAAALAEPDHYEAVPLENPPVAPSSEYLDLPDIRNSLKSLVWRAAGVRRNAAGLREAARTIDLWQRYALAKQFPTSEGWELQNMLTVARVMIGAALRREESRGVHLRTDFPQRDDAHWRIRMGDRRDT